MKKSIKKLIILTSVINTDKDDWIPKNNENFNLFSNKYMTYLNSDISLLFDGFTHFDICYNKLKGLYTIYLSKFVVGNQSQQRTKKQVFAMNKARKNFETELRQFTKEFIRYSTLVTNEMRLEMGVSNDNTIKTPKDAPNSKPIAFNIKSHEHNIVEMVVRDEKDDISNKWYHDRVEAWGKTAAAGTLVPNPTTFVYLENTKNHNLKITFPEGSSGSILYFRLRFDNGNNKKGPWGDVFSVVIS